MPTVFTKDGFRVFFYSATGFFLSPSGPPFELKPHAEYIEVTKC